MNFNGFHYDQILKRIHFYIRKLGLQGKHVKAWREDDANLLLTDDEGIFEVVNYEELTPRPEVRYAALIMVPSGSHDPTCNENPERLTVLFNYDGSPSKIPGLNNAAMMIHKVYRNGQEINFANDALEPFFKRAFERAEELFLIPHEEAPAANKVKRWVTQYTLPGRERIPQFWTGTPSKPWTFDVTEAHHFHLEQDALLMSKVLACSAAITGPRSKDAIFAHSSIDIVESRLTMH